MIAQLLKKYPKRRPALDPRIKAIYVEEYRQNRDGENHIQSLGRKLEEWMHRKIARIEGKKILEIGAGTLNHLRFEKSFKSYDIVEPFKSLFEHRPALKKIRSVYSDIMDISDEGYDKILSIATLEHVENLPQMLAKSCLMLHKKGVFQAGIPSEGGFLWGLTWRITTGLEFWLRTKLNYGNLMRHEHVNNAQEIITLCRYFFDEVKIQYFPLYGTHLSWYIYLECRKPKIERAINIVT